MDALVDLLPHRPPWRLVDRVVAREGERVECALHLSAGDALLVDGELPDLLVVEALAQAAACLNVGDMGRHRGLLVAAAGFTFTGRARAGETLRLVAVKQATLGALVRFSGEAFADGRPLTTGQLTFAVEAQS